MGQYDDLVNSLLVEANARDAYNRANYEAFDDAVTNTMRAAATAITTLEADNARLTEAVRQLRAFLNDAPKLDFNEDRTLSWMAFTGAEADKLLAPSPAEQRPRSCGLSDVAAERKRQVEVEGWTPAHDAAHATGEMARAGAAYANHMAQFHDAEALGSRYAIKAMPHGWPWDRQWWKPKDPRRDLVRAAALIVAEIDRLDALSLLPQPDTER